MILVTGATGFLGSELTKELSLQEKTVVALKRADSVIPEILRGIKNIEWRTADVLDYFSLKEALNGIQEVYHCAAVVSFDPADKKKMHRINVEGTANVVNLCLENNIRKLVHVSSVSALGEGKPNAPVTEEDYWEFTPAQSAYSISKYESEMEVFRAIAEGLNALIVTPSLIIGHDPHQRSSGRIFEMVRNGLRFYPSGGVGLVDVKDVAKAMIALMKSDISGQRFLLNSENWSYRDFFTEIALALGKKPPSIALKPWMLQIALRATQLVTAISGKHFGLTKDVVRSSFKTHNYSSQKIRETLGFQFKPARQSIQEICADMKQSFY